MKWIKNIFRRKAADTPVRDGAAVPLRIGGIADATLTAEPDDAELAAQALLEMMAEKAAGRNNVITESRNNEKENGGQEKTAAYYRQLAERIRQAHDAAMLRTMRFVAFCEQELKKHDLPLEGPGSLGLLNVELMKRIDTIERVGGELKRRWQHCLADVTVRLMQASHTDVTDSTDNNTNIQTS